ncbi:hypothetical protein BJ138DRAFT_1163129 [Hygrophoropsis aurantiaca]|uniref:Uncharacterized protein n=1 Tax=Hygrophoropsis aurantiaca TaxID=72124 RepID=A0ACB7ZZV0_9AGAM|nr:hypothetical protein BJ138DRAFT_1163129 [Hygrophoropsis aurantiaca]
MEGKMILSSQLRIIGPVGVGKSSFINTAIRRNVTTVGHDLKSCTAEIVHAITPYPSDPTRRVVFVDTPGFDDINADESEILRRIAAYIARSLVSTSFHNSNK